jgi:hypothetical protein
MDVTTPSNPSITHSIHQCTEFFLLLDTKIISNNSPESDDRQGGNLELHFKVLLLFLPKHILHRTVIKTVLNKNPKMGHYLSNLIKYVWILWSNKR